jgi:hypothetical protein
MVSAQQEWCSKSVSSMKIEPVDLAKYSEMYQRMNEAWAVIRLVMLRKLLSGSFSPELVIGTGLRLFRLKSDA